ncbi:MAG: MinD/ParA family protein [Candidatus Hydrogenedentota bacterium]
MTVGDQAEHLREYVRRHHQRARVLAVTSGKGGVGKTGISVNLGIALAARGQRVVVLDADLGLANVEVLLGLNSLYNLQHVVEGGKELVDILVEGPGGIKVIPGSSGLAKIADLGPEERANLLDGLQQLQEITDFIIIDTMAGLGQNAIAFASAADEVLVVSTPEPSSIVDAYAVIKTLYQKREDAVTSLVVNMAANKEQALAVSTKLTTVTQKYLGRKLSYHGYVPRDPHVMQAVMQTYPFVLRYPSAAASKSVQELAGRLVQQEAPVRDERVSFFRRFAQTLGLASSA